MLTPDFQTALTYLESGRTTEALPILSVIVEKWPQYAAAQVAYARALEQSGNAEASFLAWTRAEALVSHSHVVQTGLRTAAARLFGETETTPAPARTSAGTVAASAEDEVDPGRVEAEASPDQAATDVTQAEADMEPADVEAHGSVSDEDGAPSEMMDAEGAGPSSAAATAEETEHDDEIPEFAEDSASDPAFFVPIAMPIDEPEIPDTEEAHWVDSPTYESDSEASQQEPRWEGGYSGDSGDGADADFDLDAEQPPDEVELDRLIVELEAARIVPAEDPTSIPPPDLSDDIDDVVSETLARIYATQKQFMEAARVYERLALENPDRAEEFESKASEMRGRSN